MDVSSAAIRIQLAWRDWRARQGTVSGSSDPDEEAQATSGYISASSSSSCYLHHAVGSGAAAKAAPPPPRRSWTALPLNLHRFGDSSGDASPAEEAAATAVAAAAAAAVAAGAAGPLSVGASRTDLTGCPELLRLGGGPWAEDPLPRTEAAMELCFRNDAASEVDESSDDSDDDDHRRRGEGGGDIGGGEWERFCRPPAMRKDSLGSRSQQICGKSASRSLTRRPLEPELLESLGIDCSHEILSVHSRLRGEAQLALAQARPMAQMQLKVDTSSSNNDFGAHHADDDVIVDEDGGGCNWAGRLTSRDLATAGRGALMMLRACLLARIDACNSELVTHLVERDDLHMEQDSLLVEIEDFTRMAKDAAMRLGACGQAASSSSSSIHRFINKADL